MSIRPALGIYDAAVTDWLERQLSALESEQAQTEDLSAEEAPEVLARLVYERLRYALRAVRVAETGGAKDARLAAAQAELANRVTAMLAENEDSGAIPEDRVVVPPRRLLAISPAARGLGQVTHPDRPRIPISASDLLVNGRGDVSLGPEVQRELASADRVDLLCSFVKWSGLRLVAEAIEAFVERTGGRHAGPPRMRVLTTAYMGATERRALDELVRLGAEVRVSFNKAHTRLHAKAWLFHRESGFSTGCVGSSNLSASAMLDGLEWNVRLSNVDNRPILEKFRAVFDQYWSDPEFQLYDPERDGAAFEEACRREQRWDIDEVLPTFDLQPRTYQQEILDALDAERTKGYRKNLIVAATGTGKTLVAAFDYQRLCRQLETRPSLLFVAHRDEILKQSRRVFRSVLRVNDFGELLVGGETPERGAHVFASVQSLHEDRLRSVAPDAFDVVIVDEFHHAAADTYVTLLEHFQPKYLVGLTATPERADGRSILRWFDGRIASELRLWKALDQGLLAPFQYFGVGDQTDLSHAKWMSRGYDPTYLRENVYTANDVWIGQVLREVRRKVADLGRMRALGFCVDIEHAEFCADRFNRAGIVSAALSQRSSPAERKRVLSALRDGSLRVVFSVDLLNEGIDVPEVDTVFFLRPTESATVFLQQLGRGLRKLDDKPCLTVLDFIGNAHRNFRFDIRFRGIAGGTRASILREVEAGFPSLPSGCAIQLDRAASASVIANIRQALQLGRRGLADDLRGLRRDVRLAEFLRETEAEVEDVYDAAGRTFTDLRRLAGLQTPAAQPDEDRFRSVLARSTHIDDIERIDAYRAILLGQVLPDDRAPYQRMLLTLLGIADRPLTKLADEWDALRRNEAICAELLELLDVLRDRLRHTSMPIRTGAGPLPIRTHATYTLDEISAAIDDRTKRNEVLRIREGVRFKKELGVDLLFVTLRRDPKDYKPTTMYRNFVMARDLFHWETQSKLAPHHATAERYLRPPSEHQILLFVRRDREDERGMKVPYLLLGPASARSSSGERPMQIIWKLEHAMPPAFFQEAKLAAG